MGRGMVSECPVLEHIRPPSGQPASPEPGSINTGTLEESFLSGWFTEAGCLWGHGPAWWPR